MIRVRRRAPGEEVARYRDRRDGAPLKDLGARLGAWVRDHMDELRDAEPDMPIEVLAWPEGSNGDEANR